MGALKLPKETDEEQKARAAAIHIATINAAYVPLQTVKNAVKVMELAARCAKDGNLNAISDAMSGAAMARAALTAAGYNVRINLNSLEDKSAGEKMLKELADLEKQADQIEKEIRKTMEERVEFDMSHLHLRAPRVRGAGAQVLRAHFAKQSPIKLGIASSQRTLLAMT